MSYSIVSEIEITDDGKVFITSASSNVFPHSFERFEAGRLSKQYQQTGLGGILRWMAVVHRDGDCKFIGADTLSKLVRAGYNLLPDDLKHFIDNDRLGEFIENYGLTRIRGNRYFAKKAIAELEALRGNTQAVLAICKTRPGAFAYAAEEIQQNREAATAYIKQCSGMILFAFPKYFKTNKRLAMLALEQNGCIYRQLGETLQADRDIARMAFDARLNRTNFEHLPDLIPDKLRHDPNFMKEIIAICNALHVSRAPEILCDWDSALAWVQNGRWVFSDIRHLPKQCLRTPTFQEILRRRCKNAEERQALTDALAQLEVAEASAPLGMTV